MKFFLVENYVKEARVLLQDLVQPYRYDDDGLVTALNAAMYEIARIRPDILADCKYRGRLPKAKLLDDNIPELFSSDAQQEPVPIPPPYKMATIYYLCGNAQLRDVEDTTDVRAEGFMQKFNDAMTSLKG